MARFLHLAYQGDTPLCPPSVTPLVHENFCEGAANSISTWTTQSLGKLLPLTNSAIWQWFHWIQQGIFLAQLHMNARH